ncbi:MAG: hypothetical protein HYU64_05815 [Armatimonadetes bacterium]|nr:hypothetical protein [Armatimonadota bacterium]
MEIKDILISDEIRVKIERKHGVRFFEVEEATWNDDPSPWIRKSPKVPGRYVIYGQTFGGRYLKIAVRPLKAGRVELRTAVDMEDGERRDYRRHIKRGG